MKNLGFAELNRLLITVFGIRAREQALSIFVDLPDERLQDSSEWTDRRRIAVEWYTHFLNNAEAAPFDALNLLAYPNVGSNNADLPERVFLIHSTSRAFQPDASGQVPLLEVLAQSGVVISLTELSATAPLKMLARQHLFRGATMPGFSRAMMPALGLDYERVHARVVEFKNRLDNASGADLILSTGIDDFVLSLDLRFRNAHVSGGLIREKGAVANLPSGEAYIVPYEGERTKEPSLTAGVLPVQMGDEIVLFRIEGNKALDVLSEGVHSAREREKLRREPAYGNIAELGIGVLGEWGVTAVGSTLLDEKLGVHIAFGRSEHFGGFTAPANFLDQRNVIHIDWVYVPSVQPRVSVKRLVLRYQDGENETIMEAGRFTI